MIKKTIYTSSIENIGNLPTDCIIVVISNNVHKIDKAALQHKKIKVKTANKLIPPKDIVDEFKKFKNFELFKIAYMYYLIRNCTSTMDNIYSFINSTNKKVFLVTKGKTNKNNTRKILAELFYKRYTINWQEFDRKGEVEILKDFRQSAVVYKHGERFEFKREK